MDNNSIYDNNGHLIYSFALAISKIIRNMDEYIVLLNVPSGKIYNENVFCIKSNGELKWQIEKTRKEKEDMPYTNIVLNEGNLKVVNYDGWSEYIDLETGKIIISKYTK